MDSPPTSDIILYREFCLAEIRMISCKDYGMFLLRLWPGLYHDSGRILLRFCWGSNEIPPRFCLDSGRILIGFYQVSAEIQFGFCRDFAKMLSFGAHCVKFRSRGQKMPKTNLLEIKCVNRSSWNSCCRFLDPESEFLELVLSISEPSVIIQRPNISVPRSGLGN